MTAPTSTRTRLGEQSGQALVIALVIIAVGLLLGLGAVAYALSANQGSVHDERGRGAQQAADSGVQQQLYLQSSSSSVSFNFQNGVLGATGLVDCVVPPLTLSGSVNAVVGYVNSAGQCVNPSSPATKYTPAWAPDDNEDYHESEFFNVTEPQTTTTTTSGGAAGNADDVEFPEIVSLGCHTTTQPTSANATAATTACANGTAGNSYYKELALLAPTAPLSAIEASNDVTINSSSTLLTAALTSVASPLETLAGDVPGLAGTLAGVEKLCTNVSGYLGGLGFLLSALGLNLSGVTSTCTTITNLENLGAVAVVDGNVSAGHDLYLPQTVVDINSDGTGSSTFGGVVGALQTTLTSVTNAVSNLQNIQGTFEYGASDSTNKTGDVCTLSYAGKNPSVSGSNSNCYSQQATSIPVTAVGAGFVQAAGGTCTAGAPSTDCTVARPTFNVTGAISIAGATPTGSSSSSLNSTLTPTDVISGNAAITYQGGGKATYANGVITVTGDSATSTGTLSFAAGTYVLCGLYADANVGISAPASGGAAQIFILPPGNSNCTGATSSAPAGNFVSCGGIGQNLTSGISSTVNPSAFQVYVVGTSGNASGGTLPTNPDSSTAADTAVSSCPFSVSGTSPNYTTSYTATTGSDPATQVYLGAAASATLTQAYVIYAPQSELTLNSSAAFAGSLIGWNVDATATSILQDLNLGNYPISSVANAYQVAQTIECSSQSTSLTNTPPVFSTTNPGQETTQGDNAGC